MFCSRPGNGTGGGNGGLVAIVRVAALSAFGSLALVSVPALLFSVVSVAGVVLVLIGNASFHLSATSNDMVDLASQSSMFHDGATPVLDGAIVSNIGLGAGNLDGSGVAGGVGIGFA